MDRAAAAPQRRGPFQVDGDAALAELEQAWADGGYYGFCVLEHSVWWAISSVGEVLAGITPYWLGAAVCGGPAGRSQGHVSGRRTSGCAGPGDAS